MKTAKEMELICVPNDEVIEKVLNVFDEKTKKMLKDMKVTKFEFSLTLIKIMVNDLKIPLETAWDLMFGDDSYKKFKEEIYLILKNKTN